MSDPIKKEPPAGFGTDELNKRMAAKARVTHSLHRPCYAAWLVFRQHCTRRNKIYDHCYAAKGDTCSTHIGPNFTPAANAFNWCPLWERDECCGKPPNAELSDSRPKQPTT